MENQFSTRPKLSVPLANRRTQYRSEPCLKFQRGTCDYGDRCRFIHAYVDLRGFDTRQEQNAVENQNPRCSDTTKLCWKFMNGDKCQYGEKCLFTHPKPESKSEMQKLKQKQLSWRTRLCNMWMLTGSCKYGFNCFFAHGESELQKQGSNDAPCNWIDSEIKVGDKQLNFKWTNIEKTSRVYADWISINDTPPPVHVETGALAN